MDEGQWLRIQDLFHAVAELPPAEQTSYLKSACNGDDQLFEKVSELLAEDARGNSLLDRDLAQIAQESIEDSATDSFALKNIGRYKIRKLLGRGGMGAVYLAEREDLATLVAIKILPDAWVSPARRERFTFEQRTLAQLNHPSIARLYDADTTTDGTPYFAMEFVEGVPLVEYCEANGCSLPERLQLFRAVGDAVVYAHQHAILHRDLKPTNILVKQDRTVRLLDFGISKPLEALGDAANRTMTGLRLMTPAYASPEQIRGEALGIQSDVYSLGVILYQMLTGKLPLALANCTISEAERIVVEQQPLKPSAATAANRGTQNPIAFFPSVGKSEWAELDVICLTALHKDTSRRYPSVEALLRDVDHYLRKEPLDARPDTAGYRIRKFVTRNRRAVIAASALVLLVGGLVTFFTIRLAIARSAAVAEAARAERVQKFLFNLFQGGDQAAGPSDELRVVSLLDRGVQEAQSLEAEPLVQAELFQTLGTIYQKLGKLDRAETLLQSALKTRKSALGEKNPAVAENLVALGLLRASQARLPEAEQLVRSGLEMSQRTLRPGHPATARATQALGQILEDQGAYEKAIPVLEEAVRLQSARGGVPADLASSLTELANCHFYTGDYATSDAINRRVLEMDRKLYGERHPHVADDLINLGANQYEWGHYPEAEQFYRQALEIIRGWYGKNHPETASALTMIGRALVAQQKFGEAGVIAREALQIQEQVYGSVHPRVASALNEVGRVALQQGKLDEAAASFSRMADIYRSIYPNGHWLVGIAKANLAGVFMERKQFSRAENLYRDALHIYASTLPADHVNVGIGRVKLGRALLHEKRYADALVESHAGYDILAKKPAKEHPWLKNAKQDLGEEYAALKQPEEAAKFRDASSNPQ